jgi:transposase InsO family protein
MTAAAGVEPHHLLRPTHPNHVWHVDLTALRILWFRFTAAAILDGFSRKLLRLRVYSSSPRQRDLARLVQSAARKFGTPRFLITDHGTQFRNRFHAAMAGLNIRHVKGRVRSPYLNGKMERAFRRSKKGTFKISFFRSAPPQTKRPLLRRP